MELLIACSAGARRSTGIVSYIEKHKGSYGLNDLQVTHCGLTLEKFERDRAKKEKRLRRLEKRHGEAVRRLRSSESPVHPRIGVLLLEEGVDEVLDLRARVATPELLEESDLVLAVDQHVMDSLPGESQTVKTYLGGEGDIPDCQESYKWFTVGYQLRKDREMLHDLRMYAIGILGRIHSQR